MSSENQHLNMELEYDAYCRFKDTFKCARIINLLDEDVNIYSELTGELLYSIKKSENPIYLMKQPDISNKDVISLYFNFEFVGDQKVPITVVQASRDYQDSDPVRTAVYYTNLMRSEEYCDHMDDSLFIVPKCVAYIHPDVKNLIFPTKSNHDLSKPGYMRLNRFNF